MKIQAMVTALDYDQILPNLSIWHAYDNAVKADLFSTAISVGDRIFLIDPIQLDETALAQLLQRRSVTGLIVTNNNHFRASEYYIRRFSVPIFGHQQSLPIGSSVNYSEIADEMVIGQALDVIAIDGAATGEIALYHAADGGTLIMGDALINFEPYGFTFLPDKYCRDVRQMRNSLRKLLRFKAERMLFAHGLPILSGASQRLEQLLPINL